jgi:taurine dioxygenase
MHPAYDALPQEIKTRLDGMTATHSLEKFWESYAAGQGQRPIADDEQRKRRPPCIRCS